MAAGCSHWPDLDPIDLDPILNEETTEKGCSDYESDEGNSDDDNEIVYDTGQKLDKERVFYKRSRNVSGRWDEGDFETKLPFWGNVAWREWPPRAPVDTPFDPKDGSAQVGPSEELLNEDLVQIFGKLMSPTLDMVKGFTNQYGQEDCADWKDVTADEMMKFVIVLLRIACVKRKKLTDYWTRGDTDPIITRLNITCRRFLAIFQHIRLYDPKVQASKGFSNRLDPIHYDSLYKIRPVWSTTMKSFQSCYKAEQYLSLDETMSKFLGKLAITQVLRRKPDPVGLKIDSICAPNGYYLNGEVHSGEPIPYDVTLGRTIAVVFHLLAGRNFEGAKDYLNENRVIFTDLAYTSVALANCLLAHKTYLIGTCKSAVTGLVPKDIMKGSPLVEGMKLGGMVWRHSNNGMDMLGWKDARVVNVLSSFPSIGRGFHVVKRKEKGTINGKPVAFTQDILCPDLVALFSKNMAGVDLFGQRRKARHRHTKTRRWYVGSIFSFLIDAASVNTAIIYKWRKNVAVVDNWECKSKLVEGLCQILTSDTKAERPRKRKFNFDVESREEIRRGRFDLSKGHFPQLHDDESRQTCIAHRRQKKTRYKCSWCQIPLCPECMARFHTKEQYILDDVAVGIIVNNEQLF